LHFDPDRHAGSGSAPALLPFALGPRGCVGQHLALEEVSMIARCLAGRDVVAAPVEEDAGFALRPRGSLRGRLVAR